MGRIRGRLARCAFRRPCRGNRQRADENISTLHDPSKWRELGRRASSRRSKVRLPSGRRECGRRYQTRRTPCTQQPGCDKQLGCHALQRPGSIRDERGCGPQGVPQRGADRLHHNRGRLPDALSAGAAAASMAAPLLLVSPTAIPAAVATELERLAPGRDLRRGERVSFRCRLRRRCGGSRPVGLPPPCSGYPDRIATRRRLPCRSDSSHRRPAASRSWSRSKTARTHFGFALGYPILLCPGNVVSTAVIAEIRRLDDGGVIILGGYAVISQQAEDQLRAALS